MNQKKTISIMGAVLIAASINMSKVDACGLDTTRYQVVSKTLNVRKGPGTEYGIITNVKKGRAFAQYDNSKKGDWRRIKLPNNIIGWANTNAKYMKKTTETQFVLENSDVQLMCSGKVTAKSLNVRKGPGTKYAIKDKLSKGTDVDILQKTGKWYFIEYQHNGRFATGYVSSSLIEIIK